MNRIPEKENIVSFQRKKKTLYRKLDLDMAILILQSSSSSKYTLSRAIDVTDLIYSLAAPFHALLLRNSRIFYLVLLQNSPPPKKKYTTSIRKNLRVKRGVLNRYASWETMNVWMFVHLWKLSTIALLWKQSKAEIIKKTSPLSKLILSLLTLMVWFEVGT